MEKLRCAAYTIRSQERMKAGIYTNVCERLDIVEGRKDEVVSSGMQVEFCVSVEIKTSARLCCDVCVRL